MKPLKQISLYIVGLILYTTLWFCAGSTDQKRAKLAPSISSVNIQVDSGLQENPELEALIAPYRREMNKLMEEVIGFAAMDLKKGRPEAPLNNYVSDLILKRANREYPQPVHAAVTNVSGLRREIPRGPITVGEIYEVYPFDNELVVLKMSGSQIRELAQQIGEKGGECIAGLKIEFQDKILSNILINQKKINLDTTYFVVTHDYLSSPGREDLGILGRVPGEALGVFVREAIIDEIRNSFANNIPVRASIDGRIVFR
jgi:2',3'-cyclic-nucleotide 2'-phosphodiesterase (5'-nucleotidase family)